MTFDNSEGFPAPQWFPGDDVHGLFGRALVQAHRFDSNENISSVLDGRMGAMDWLAEFRGPFDPSSFIESSTGKPTSVREGEIVITGERVHHYTLPTWTNVHGGNTGWTETGAGDGGSGDGTAAPPDEASIDVTVNLTRPLTASETAAIEHLKESIASITAAIAALSDSAIVTLPNGADVTGAELKVLWSKTDFTINETGHVYSSVTDAQGNTFPGNSTDRGQANPNWGNPAISFNIDLLDEYDNNVGGMNYLVAHELGHISQANTLSYYSDERTANDLARALLNGYGLQYLANPGFGYSPTAPTQFSVPPPPPPPPPTGGSGGGEGGGWGPDEP